VARILAGGTFAAGCFAPTPQPGLVCGPGDSCPGGLECSAAGTCELPGGSGPDAPPGWPDGPPVDAEIDAEQPDANPMAIEVSFGETGTATYSGVTTDSTLETGVASNRAGETHVSVQDASWEGMYRFDVSAIASATAVLDVRLELSTEDGSNVLTAGEADIFRLREDWDEATTTYFLRRTGQPWTAMGADPPLSRDDEPIAKFRPDTDGRWTMQLPESMVAEWIADPAQNAGLIVETTNGAVGHLHLGSSEGAPGRAPLLIVTYLP
jgi:hypothetical protein